MLRKVFFVLLLAGFAATSTLASPSKARARTARPQRSVTPHNPSAHGGARRSTAASSSRVPRRSPSRTAAAPRKKAHARVARDRSVAAGRYPRRTRRLRRGSAFDTASIVPASVSLTRRVSLPPALRGSFESLARQNERAEADGLERILDENDLSDRIAQGLLVQVPTSSALYIDETLPETHKYCRPWTAIFLNDLAEAHSAQFRHALFVSSAVRTVDYQAHLMHRNGNAAAAEGDVVSPHLTGGTIDIAKNGMSRRELAWMRNWLLAQQLAGLIDVEEEFRQPCFHITVYKNYASPTPGAAPGSQPRTAALPVATKAPGL